MVPDRGVSSSLRILGATICLGLKQRMPSHALSAASSASRRYSSLPAAASASTQSIMFLTKYLCGIMHKMPFLMKSALNWRTVAAGAMSTEFLNSLGVNEGVLTRNPASVGEAGETDLLEAESVEELVEPGHEIGWDFEVSNIDTASEVEDVVDRIDPVIS